MTTSQLRKKIGLWGFYGFGNLGDAAIQQAVIQNIRERLPKAEIYGICLSPDDTKNRYDIPAFPIYRGRILLQTNGLGESGKQPDQSLKTDKYQSIKLVLRKIPPVDYLVKTLWVLREELRFLWKMYRFEKELDVLIISGSGALDDTWQGRWKRPFALFRWALLARLNRIQLIFMSVGATSLTSTLGRFFAKYALSMASYRSFRDTYSQDLAKRIGVKGGNLVFPDLAYSLEVGQYRTRANTDRITVGIGPIPYCDPRSWPDKNSNVYKNYIHQLSSIVSWLVEEEGHNVVFIVGEMHMDPTAIADVRAALKGGNRKSTGSVMQENILTADDLMGQFAKTDFVVTSRFHGVLLPYLLEKPVLALSYDKKIDNLMEAAGQSQYCLDINHFDLQSFVKTFTHLKTNRDAIVAKLRAQNVLNRTALKAQYDRVLKSLSTNDRCFANK